MKSGVFEVSVVYRWVCVSFDMSWCQVVLKASAGAAFDPPQSEIFTQREREKNTMEFFFYDTVTRPNSKRTNRKETQ